jgi:ubiquinone/menaquinone biosynthesis C-methylase UbiE
MKLNLGCGYDIREGYINVDLHNNDPKIIKHDLETIPYPWEDNSITEIVMRHVLEHLGQNPKVYIAILKDLYRICKDGAIIDITVPHHNHDNFKNDPTHVRIVTPEGLQLFSKKFNQYCIENKFANSTLGLYHNIDFELLEVNEVFTPNWKDNDFNKFAKHAYNNVIEEYNIKLKVVKNG